jgi:hypothetical protein
MRKNIIVLLAAVMLAACVSTSKSPIGKTCTYQFYQTDSMMAVAGKKDFIRSVGKKYYISDTTWSLGGNLYLWQVVYRCDTMKLNKKIE